MRGTTAAWRTAGADQSFIHDLADGAGAAAALGAAAETAVNLAGGARRRRIHGALEPHNGQFACGLFAPSKNIKPLFGSALNY
jgi:hypothetical protein